MAGDVTIHLAEAEKDLVDIVNLRAQDVSESQEDIRAWNLAMVKVMKNEGNHFWLARTEEEPAGYAVGQEVRNGYFSQNIYVAPGKRKRGIGSLLKKSQVAFAENLGLDEIYSYLRKDNLASKRMQEKRGFTLISVGKEYYKTVHTL